MRARVFFLVAPWFTAAAALGASCTFPDFAIHDIASGGSGGEGGDASSSSSGNGGNGAATSSSAGGDGGGGGLPPDPKCTGSGGAGGAGGTGGSGGAGGSGGTGGVIECDADRDGQDAMEFPCCGTDCDDTDPNAFKFQTEYFGVANSNLAGDGFDYDCDGEAEKDKDQLINQTGDLAGCADGLIGAVCKTAEGYGPDAKCGENVDGYYECVGLLVPNCSGQEIPPPGPLLCK
jgi:hypothetical protein